MATDSIQARVGAHLTRLVATWLADGRSHCTASIHINMGPCAEFAEEAVAELEALLGEGVEVALVDSVDMEESGQLPEGWPDYHCFIKVAGLFYDATETEGVRYPLLLPFFLERRGLIRRLEKAASEDA